MMKFNCEKHILQEAVNIASRAVSPRSALPVLEGILLEANGDTLKLTGYDLKKGVLPPVTAPPLQQALLY